MSELHIGLVAEGVTDQIVIETALKAILTQSFVLTRLPAEATRDTHRGGWCGVFKWCKEFRALGHAGLAQDPTLELFDLVIVHLDGDRPPEEFPLRPAQLHGGHQRVVTPLRDGHAKQGADRSQQVGGP